jgi:RNA polymerase sigma-70 factor (ECF subfamily)
LRRIGRWSEASVADQRALDLVQNDPQRRYLARRLEEVTAEAT